MYGHRGDETIAAAVECLNPALGPPAIAKGFTDHHQPLRQDPRADVAIGPQVLEEFLLRDYTVAVLEEVDEEIQGLRLDLAQCPGVAQFVALGIKRIVPKGVDHLPAPPGCTTAPVVDDISHLQQHTSPLPTMHACAPGRCWFSRHYHTENLEEILRKSSCL
jgi:hypothetical protein